MCTRIEAILQLMGKLVFLTRFPNITRCSLVQHTILNFFKEFCHMSYPHWSRFSYGHGIACVCLCGARQYTWDHHAKVLNTKIFVEIVVYGKWSWFSFLFFSFGFFSKCPRKNFGQEIFVGILTQHAIRRGIEIAHWKHSTILITILRPWMSH